MENIFAKNGVSFDEFLYFRYELYELKTHKVAIARNNLQIKKVK